jgi:hypothetical protein
MTPAIPVLPNCNHEQWNYSQNQAQISIFQGKTLPIEILNENAIQRICNLRAITKGDHFPLARRLITTEILLSLPTLQISKLVVMPSPFNSMAPTLKNRRNYH